MKNFSVAMLIIGTIIGAGFASGRELVSFFGTNPSLWIAPIAAALIFVFSAMFMFIGAKTKATNISEVNKNLLGKAHLIFDIMLLVNSFIVLSGMLAGIDSLFSSFKPLRPLYSCVFGTACIFVVVKGVKGLLNCNKIVVPFMVIGLIIICITVIQNAGKVNTDIVLDSAGLADITAKNSKSVSSFLSPLGTVITSIIYICMNMMLASTVLSTMGEIKTKNIIISSLIAAVIMGVLILLLIMAINVSGTGNADMPVIEMTKKYPPLYYFITAVVAVSIFTTMLSAMSGLADWFSKNFSGRIFSCVVVFLGALALSFVGFSNVVDHLYPFIGLVGLVYTLVGCLFVLRKSAATRRLFKPFYALFDKRNTAVHKRRKQA